MINLKFPFSMDKKIKKLIENTDSMDTQEKQYWCDIWNSMKDEQQGRFKDILLIEKSKLNEIEQKYQEDFKKINDNFLKRNRFYNEKKR